MPVSPETLRRPEAILKNRSDAVHSLLDETTRLPFLGDVIPLPAFRNAVSPGDLFILLGIAGVVVEGALRAAGARPFRRR